MTMNDPGVLESVREGLKGQILAYVRPNRRSPARDFRQKMPEHLRQKFNHIFRRVCAEGLTNAATHHQSIAPLANGGKGLWAFKEHDHRFYAFRAPSSNGVDRLVLLNGFVKDKTESKEGDRAIESALRLKNECVAAVDWTAAPVPYGSTKLDTTPLTLGEVFVDTLDISGTATARVGEGSVMIDVEMPNTTAMEVMQAINTTPSFYESITVDDLAKKLGVCSSTIRGWYNKGLLPPARTGPRRAYFWDAHQGPELMAKIEAVQKEHANKDPGRKYRGDDGVYRCPKCSAEFSSGMRLFLHIGKCGDDKVLSRKELLKLAERVIDGKAKAEEFAAAADKHLEQTKRLEAELKKLRGKR